MTEQARLLIRQGEHPHARSAFEEARALGLAAGSIPLDVKGAHYLGEWLREQGDTLGARQGCQCA